jgi:hypothetical protein
MRRRRSRGSSRQKLLKIAELLLKRSNLILELLIGRMDGGGSGVWIIHGERGEEGDSQKCGWGEKLTTESVP